MCACWPVIGRGRGATTLQAWTRAAVDCKQNEPAVAAAIAAAALMCQQALRGLWLNTCGWPSKHAQDACPSHDTPPPLLSFPINTHPHTLPHTTPLMGFPCCTPLPHTGPGAALRLLQARAMTGRAAGPNAAGGRTRRWTGPQTETSSRSSSSRMAKMAVTQQLVSSSRSRQLLLLREALVSSRAGRAVQLSAAGAAVAAAAGAGASAPLRRLMLQQQQ